jgi:hypothetical protein
LAGAGGGGDGSVTATLIGRRGEELAPREHEIAASRTCGSDGGSGLGAALDRETP